MNLLRFYLTVGGENFRAKDYDDLSRKNGLRGGGYKYIEKPLIYPCGRSAPDLAFRLNTGIPGTGGEGFFLWKTETIEYATNEVDYNKKNSLLTNEGGARVWIEEERAILDFLKYTQPILPKFEDFCDGDFFVHLKCIYGELDDGRCVLPFYSAEMVKALGEMGAGIECDAEPPDIHFLRISNQIKK